jgi:hypothetical protein
VLTILAQVLTKPPPSGLWYPTIVGILVVAAAIALFCGSIYVLLATNLGARLGFLVAFTALTGFMVLLSVLWVFTASPLNTLKGTIPAWHVEKVVKSLNDESLPAPVRDIKGHGQVVSATGAQAIKAIVDAKLVVQQPAADIPLQPNANQFAQFSAVTDYKETNYYETGGSTPHLLDWQINHQPLYAVAQFCSVLPNTQPFGLPPPTPTCDPSSTKNGYVVLRYDYGSLRLPPFVVLVLSSILFVLGLLGLHWREKDERAQQRAAEQTTPLRERESPPLVGAPR